MVCPILQLLPVRDEPDRDTDMEAKSSKGRQDMHELGASEGISYRVLQSNFVKIVEWTERLCEFTAELEARIAVLEAAP